MTNEELRNAFTEIEPSVIYEEGGEWINAVVPVDQWKNVATKLRITNGLDMDFLFCITCIDWKTYLMMVYHFTSTIHRHTLVIKVKLDRATPAIETVSDIWRTAEFHEREVYDLFGVIFINHPDLRRLFLTDEWKGWPLRKDYEDPVNMIKL